MVAEYLKQLHKKYDRGDAREESYYSTLEEFLKNYSETKRKRKIDITILPKKTEAGNPDFRIWDGKQDIIGYIEAKDIGKDLDLVEDSDQLKRYLKTFPNVILTNYTEFRLYRDGKKTDKVFIAYPNEITRLHTTPILHNEEKLKELLNKFFSFSLPRKFTAKTLAVELAKRTRFLKDEIISSEIETDNEELRGFYEAFKEYLIAGLSIPEFIDLYSQTITYGLFAARLRAGKSFTRREAIKYIPKSIGILRDIFRFISSADLPIQMEAIIDDISAVLAAADAKIILDQYYRDGKGSDPVLHFYETFLAEYDSTTREKRGVYYTPEPVVSFIVRSLHLILKEKFNKPLGLADKGVTLLDPAGGTLSFNAKAIEIAVEEFVNNFGEGGKKKFIKEHILENFYAFELMMAPYAIGHMKLSFLLEELGYIMKDEERAKFYLTNTLEMKELEETRLPGMSSLSYESHEAGKIKKNVPILLIHGNPPYSGVSANPSEKKIKIGKDQLRIVGYEIVENKSRGKITFTIAPKVKLTNKAVIVNQKTWIGEQIENYKIIDGKWFGERKHWLQDDYVKFIRFSQWKIDQFGEGVLAFISNNSYLDNPTFRGMRQSLMNSFDEIFILDLHGHIGKNEKTIDGGKDENIFDSIEQGVCISIFIKHNDLRKQLIKHYEIYGTRELKYDWLTEHSLTDLPWNFIEPKSPFYLFLPSNQEHGDSYKDFRSLKDVFLSNTVGIVTARDHLSIDFEKEKLWRRIKLFSTMDIELARTTFKLRKDVRDWKVSLAQKDVINSGLSQDKIQPISYRPFDQRWIYYTGTSRGIVGQPCFGVMRNMLTPNIGLFVCRQQNKLGFTHAFITDKFTESCLVSNKTREIGYLMPLYKYPENKRDNLFSATENQDKQSNIREEILQELSKKFNMNVKPEEVFYYIYGILYSNSYRLRYVEFLKLDFPRIPFTNNYKLFIQLGKLGKELADLHLLKSDELNKPISKLSGKGNDKVTFRPKWIDNKVYINAAQYFTNISEEVWKYQIGGYQVCEKWLKDRKDRELSLDEIEAYCKIITALDKTIGLQKEIDSIYNRIE